MAVLKPFKAYRPAPGLADKVAALPYDVMSSDEARQMVVGKPYSFLHVDKAEIDLDPSIDVHDEVVYEKARDNLYGMIKDKIFVQDKEDSLYIYKQIMNDRSQVGLVGTTSIDDYLNNIIKKHEFTRADKELDRINHVDYTNANTGPIFLTYRTKDDISKLIDSWMENKDPVYDFLSEDGISHTVWHIDDRGIVDELVAKFSGVDYLYIADGHHRAASAVKIGLKRRELLPDFSGHEEFNFFLAVLFPDEDLYIMDYNRVVRDLNEYSTAEFMELLSQNFDVMEYVGEGQYKPEAKHYFGMYLDEKWYKMKAKAGSFDEESPVDRLDVSILQKNVLTPLLGILDPRIDNRIDFVGGIRGLAELENRVDDGGMRLAFSMFPTSIADLMAIADAGEVMPPKSTWFEPKLRSGLFIHTLD